MNIAGSGIQLTVGCQDKKNCVRERDRYVKVERVSHTIRYFDFVIYTKDVFIYMIPRTAPSLRFSHVHHTPDAIPRLHILERSIDLVQRLPVRDELIHLELARHVVVHQIRELRAPFDPAKSAPFPYAAGDEVEC